MRWWLSVIVFILGFGCKPSIYLQQSGVQLSIPKVNADKQFFESEAQISIGSTAKHADIMYSVSGSKWQSYKSPIRLKESSKIQAVARGGGFIPSDTVTIEVLKMPKNEIISIASERQLDEKYGSGGLDLLINREKGKTDYSNGWLGYLGDTVTFNLEFDIIDLDHIIVTSLVNQGAWIFSPARINIYNEGKMIGTEVITNSLRNAQNSTLFTSIDVSDTSTRSISVEVIAPQSLPDWHPGSGNKPWFFIDEILVY